MLGNHMFLPSLSPFISAFPVSDLPPAPRRWSQDGAPCTRIDLDREENNKRKRRSTGGIQAKCNSRQKPGGGGAVISAWFSWVVLDCRLQVTAAPVGVKVTRCLRFLPLSMVVLKGHDFYKQGKLSRTARVVALHARSCWTQEYT